MKCCQQSDLRGPPLFEVIFEDADLLAINKPPAWCAIRRRAMSGRV